MLKRGLFFLGFITACGEGAVHDPTSSHPERHDVGAPGPAKGDTPATWVGGSAIPGPGGIPTAGTNTAPVARAGADLSAAIGDPVVLDGSASSDVDGDALAFRWALIAVPSGSTTHLVDAMSATTWFVPDVAGEYVVGLVVSDGQLSSATDSLLVDVIDSTTVTPPTGSSFSDLCAQPDVIACRDFDLPPPHQNGLHDLEGVFVNNVSNCAAYADCPTLDNGALKFTISSQSGAGSSGQYFLNFAQMAGSAIFPGESVYVRWKQRFSAEMLTNNFTGDGWKQSIIGAADEYSCSSNEITMQNIFQRNVPQLYHACGYYEPFLEPMSGNDFDLQPPHQCSYHALGAGITDPNCHYYYANEWMTFQIGIDIDPSGHGRVRLWVAREGDVQELVVDYSRQLRNAQGGYGKVWLTPYISKKDSSRAHPVAHTWYDELIVSRSPIGLSAPTGGPAGPTNGAPSAHAGSDQSVTLGNQVSLDGSSSADPDGDALTHQWAFVTVPAGSAAMLVGSTSASASFVPDQTGTYVVSLTVSDGQLTSAIDSVTIQVATSGGPPPTTDDNFLTQTGATMSVGEFRDVSALMGGFDISLIDAGQGRTILEWSNQGYWDPIRNQFRFHGQGHNAASGHIEYDAASNAWSNVAISGFSGIGHGYEHNAMDTATGDNYYMQYAQSGLRRYSPDSDTWTILAPLPTAVIQITRAVEFFPELGGIVVGDYLAGTWLWDSATDTWAQLSGGHLDSGPPPNVNVMATYNNYGAYNPTSKIMIFGGGNSNNVTFKVDSQAVVSRVADSPVSFGISGGIVLPNPSTGTFLGLHHDGNVYEYDPISDSWSVVGAGNPFSGFNPNNGQFRIAGCIPEYGLYLLMTKGPLKVWLYKYSP